MQVEEGDSVEKAQEKVTKLLDELAKNYEAAGKQLFKTKQSHISVRASTSTLIQMKTKDKKPTNKKKCLKTFLMASKRNTMIKSKMPLELRKKSKIRENKKLKSFKKE